MIYIFQSLSQWDCLRENVAIRNHAWSAIINLNHYLSLTAGEREKLFT